MIKEYVFLIEKLLVKPKNELLKLLDKKKSKNVEDVVDKYDKVLLEKYRYIEQLMSEELEK